MILVASNLPTNRAWEGRRQSTSALTTGMWGLLEIEDSISYLALEQGLTAWWQQISATLGFSAVVTTILSLPVSLGPVDLTETEWIN